MTTRDIIDCAANDNAVEFRKEMYAAIHDKVSAHIENRKQELAQGLVTQSESASDWEAEKEHKPAKSSDADKKHVEKYKAGMTKTNDKITAHSKKVSDKHDKESKSGKWVSEEVEELDEEVGDMKKYIKTASSWSFGHGQDSDALHKFSKYGGKIHTEYDRSAVKDGITQAMHHLNSRGKVDSKEMKDLVDLHKHVTTTPLHLVHNQ